MRYDLVFEGGGARGVVFVGALQEFEARGHRFGRLLGTSAGAITAVLLAAGYSAGELHAAVREQVDGKSVFTSFLGVPAPFSRDEIQNSATRAFLRDVDSPLLPNLVEEKLDDALTAALLRFPVHRNLMAFVERGGWYSADHFGGWMRTRLDSGFYRGEPRRFGDMTLARFYEATGVDLSVVAADTTAGRLRVLNHSTAPECPVVWAVRLSMNLPFLWQDVLWREEWGPYLGQSLAGHVMVDGGILSSFPLELFLSSEPYVQALMGAKSSDRVLGLLIDERLAVPDDPGIAPRVGGLDLAGLRTVQRIARMLNTMMGARDKMVMDAFSGLVARLPAKGYGMIEFDMDNLRRERLISGGRQALRSYFDHPKPAESIQPDTAIYRAAQSQADRIALALLAP